MQSVARPQRVIEVLHYVTPIAVFCYYIVATTVGVCTLQTVAVDGKKSARTAVLGATSTVLILYVSRTTFNIRPSLADQSRFAKLE